MPSSWWRRKWRSAQSEPRNQLLIPMKKRVWWSFGVALAMLGTIGATSYREVLKLRTNDAMVDHTHQVISSLRKVQSLVTDAETGQRGYLITGDEHYLTRYQESLESLDEQFAALRALIADNPEQETNCQALLKLVTTRMVQLRDVLLVREKRDLIAAGTQILLGAGQSTDLAIREQVQKMETLENGLLLAREDRAYRTSVATRAVILLGSLLAFCFVGIALYLISEDIAGRRRANAALQEAKDHLEVRVAERTADLKASNEKLRCSREQYAVTLTSIGDGVITTDAECRVSF